MGLKAWVSPDCTTPTQHPCVLKKSFGCFYSLWKKPYSCPAQAAKTDGLCVLLQVSPVVWIISYGLEFIIIAALTTAICCASFFKETDPSLLFLVLLLFTVAELAFGMMVRSFSSASM